MRLIIETDNRAVLKTRAVPAVMNVARQFEGRRSWLKAGGLSFEPTNHNLSLLNEAVKDLEFEDLRGGAEFEFDALPIREPYMMKMKPFEYQENALLKMSGMPNFGLFMEQGTGKTKVTIDRAGDLFCKGKISAVIVVAPKGVHTQWALTQLPIHSGCDWEAACWPLKKLPPQDKDKLNYFCINFDGLRTAKGLAMATQFVSAHNGKVLMVVDESHNIKNAKSKRWEACNTIGKLCLIRLILTGTPIAKDLSDEWSQMKFLDEKIIGIRYLSAFRREFCIMGGFEGRMVIGHRNVENFRSRVDPYTFRATKSELGMLPKQYGLWRFQLAPKQKAMLKTMKKALIAEIDSGEVTTAQHAATAFLRMQQIANGFIIDEDGVAHDIFDKLSDNPRIYAAKDFLDSKEGKIVIWAHFHKDIENLKELLGDKAVIFYGKTSDKDRALAKKRFIEDEAVKYFVASPASAGTGTDGLQHVCNQNLYYSNSENSIQRWQSEDRVDRIGTKDNQSFNTDLIAIGSTDAKILGNLRNKKTISEMAIGDIKTWLEGDDEELSFNEDINKGDF